MTIRDHVSDARVRLIRAGIQPAHAASDAEVLARHVLGWDRTTFLLNRHEMAASPFKRAYASLVARRAEREPVALITGHREFWGLEFEVTPDVLVPRPETELLVEHAIALARRKSPDLCVVDAGTGSGCLAVALARALPAARIVATDISLAALAVARRNARRHGVRERIGWIQTSFLAGLGVAPDLVIANPPYVARQAGLQPSPELRFEPEIALFGGRDGLAALRQLIGQAADALAPNGELVVEFGYDQEEAVRHLVAQQRRLGLIAVASDLQGLPRVAVIGRAQAPALAEPVAHTGAPLPPSGVS